jgi:hypothetical protein
MMYESDNAGACDCQAKVGEKQKASLSEEVELDESVTRGQTIDGGGRYVKISEG